MDNPKVREIEDFTLDINNNQEIQMTFSILLFAWGPEKANIFRGTIQLRSPFSTFYMISFVHYDKRFYQTNYTS